MEPFKIYFRRGQSTSSPCQRRARQGTCSRAHQHTEAYALSRESYWAGTLSRRCQEAEWLWKVASLLSEAGRRWGPRPARPPTSERECPCEKGLVTRVAQGVSRSRRERPAAEALPCTNLLSMEFCSYNTAGNKEGQCWVTATLEHRFSDFLSSVNRAWGWGAEAQAELRRW